MSSLPMIRTTMLLWTPGSKRWSTCENAVKTISKSAIWNTGSKPPKRNWPQNRLQACIDNGTGIEDHSEGAPICRWAHDDLRFDVMPTDERILGFSNRWLGHALLLANLQPAHQEQALAN